MMIPLEIVLAGPYNALYLGGFTIGLLLAWREGMRRGWPTLPWVVILLAVVAGGIAGSKLFHLDLLAAEPGEKTILGGMLGGALALGVARRVLHFDREAPTGLLLAVPVGFAIGRLGCFLVGCCFGRTTGLPWGVRYAPGTEPYAAQLAAGMIEAGAAASLPVHPTQLYEAVLAVLAGALLWRMRHRFLGTGSPLLGLATAYGATRFSIEFLRAGGSDMYLGLRTVQWTVAACTIGAGAALVWRELSARSGRRERALGARRPRPVLGSRQPGKLDDASCATRALLVVAVILVAALEPQGWFTPLERLTILATVAPVLILLVRRPFPRRVLGHALAGTLVIVPVGAETLRPWTGASAATAGDTVSGFPRSWFTVGVSGMRGEYETVHRLNPADDCSPTETREHTYTIWGLSGGYTNAQASDRSQSLRAQAFAGTNRVEVSGNAAGSVQLRGGAVVGSIEDAWVGLSAGVSLGSVMSRGDEVTARFVGGIRGGRRDGLFGELRYNDTEHPGAPTDPFRLAIGHGFGRTGSNVRIGAWNGGLFVTGNLVTPRGLELEPFASLGDPHFGLAVRHRFGLRSRPTPAGAAQPTGQRP